MMPAGTLIHYECRTHPLAAEARNTSGSPSIDTVLKLSDRTSYITETAQWLHEENVPTSEDKFWLSVNWAPRHASVVFVQ
jgi:hypothetical protein